MPLSLIAISCAPISVPSTPEIERCPQACPVACPMSCLPSGYCSQVEVTAADLKLAPIQGGSSWTANLPGFPPNQDVAFALNVGFDIVERDGGVPTFLDIALDIGGQRAVTLNNLVDAFPVWSSFQSDALSGADGTLPIACSLLRCEALLPNDLIAAPHTCLLAPTSTFTATLVNTEPWLEAPVCGQ